MNSSLHIANELIDYLDRYEKETGRGPEEIREFLVWLNHLVLEEQHYPGSGDEEKVMDMELTFLLVLQSKNYKLYCKEALVNTEINSPDEYSFLYHLSLVDSFRKMELVHIHLLEAPSGIEVIKRLLKKGFIEEFDDQEDKRAKRVRITKKGRKETDRLAPKMQNVYSRMTAELSLREKVHVLYLLRKLNDHHKKPLSNG